VLPVRERPQALEHLLLLGLRLESALLEPPLAGAGLEVPDVAEEEGDQGGGALAPSGPGDVDLPGAPHAVGVEEAGQGVPGLHPTRQPGQVVEEVIVPGPLQVGHHLRMRADDIGHVQQGQSHLRGDVAGRRLGQGIGRLLLAQPGLQVLVEPPAGVLERQDGLESLRVEQRPPQLLDVRPDEVEQRRPRQGPDVLPEGGDGGPAALDQPGDDGRIDLDRVRSATAEPPGGAVVRPRGDEAVAFEHRPERLPDARIGSP